VATGIVPVRLPTSLIAKPTLPVMPKKPPQTRQPPPFSSKYGGRPIHLTATAAVSASAQASVNSQALHVPTAEPIIVTHFKFGYSMAQPYVSGGAVQGLYADGGTLQCQIGLNNDVITNGFVPIWNFGESINLVNEMLMGSENSGGNCNNYGEFVWELPKPLYLRPADQLSVLFYNVSQLPFALTARFSLQGFVCAPGTKDPKSRFLPYAASYVSKIFQTSNADSDSSTEQDLVNNTDTTLYLDKLTGRLDEFTSATSYRSDGMGSNVTGAQEPSDPAGMYALTLLAQTGKGQTLIPYASTFRAALCGATRAWKFRGGLLEPGDYVIASLILAAQSSFTTYAQAHIGMTGHREVSL
jgi:hypothetical protein